MATLGRTKKDGSIPEQTGFFGDLVGGVDLNASPTSLPAYKAQELRNFSLQEAGALVTLEGYEEYLDAALTGGPGARFQGGDRIYIGDTPITLVAFDGAVVPVNDDGTVDTAVITGLNADNEILFAQDSKVVLVVDGDSAPKISSDGEVFYDAGIDVPPSAPSLSAVAGGSLITTDEYEVSFSFGSSSAFDPELVHEGNESPRDTQVVTAPNLTVRVTANGSDDPKVDTIYIYARNVTAGQPVRRLVGQTTNTDSVTPWTFDITTEPNEAALAPNTDNDLPLAFRHIIFWKNRFWALHPTIPNRLHFTPIFEPQSWPATYYLDLPLLGGDALTNFVPIGDVLDLFGKTGIYILSGISALDFDVRPALSVETGSIGPRAAVKIEAGVLHAGFAGVFLFNGAQDLPVSADIATGWRDMMQQEDAEALGRIALTYMPRLSHAMVAVPRLYPIAAPGEYVLDLVRMRVRNHETWFKTNRDIGGYIPFLGNEPDAGDFGRIISWATTGGMLHEERIGNDANGGNLTAIYITAAHHTQFRETMLVNGFVEYQPATGILTIDLFVNDQMVNSQSFNVNAALSVYGDAEYGSAQYGGGTRQKLPVMFPLPADGTVFHLRFTFQGTSRFKLFSYGFGAVPESVIRTLR